jgi:predicted DNA-binding transcriptional regulator AlpA
MRLLTEPDLKERDGYSRQHRHKLIREGLHPKPIKLGRGPQARNYWPEHVMDAHYARKTAEAAA